MTKRDEKHGGLSLRDLKRYDKMLQDYGLGKGPKPNLPIEVLRQVRDYQGARLSRKLGLNHR